MSISGSDSSSSRGVHYKPDEGAFVKMVESGQIGFRLAEEIKILREELLAVKQEKRILLVSNENLEESLVSANNTISAMHAKLVDLQHHVQFFDVEVTKKESACRANEDDLRQLKKQQAAEKKKNKLLAEELERSLEDEVTLRGYSRRLELDVAAQKEQLEAALERNKCEREERLKCEQFIDSSLRSQLIFQKKIETVVYYCDKDVDISSVAIFDVSPDYLESLLRDVKNEKFTRFHSDSDGLRAKFDFSVLEHKQHQIDHQLNQYLNSIRSHMSKHRKAQAKSRKHLRSLLDVIRTYEELPESLPAAAAHPYYKTYGDEGLCANSSIREWDRVPNNRRTRGEPSVRPNWGHDSVRISRNISSSSGSREAMEPSLRSHHANANSNASPEPEVECMDTYAHPPTSDRFGHSASVPVDRHRHYRENPPSPAHTVLSPGRRRPSGSPPRGGRTLALLEQLQREMERELQA